MSVRPILQWPDRRLRTAAGDVAEVTDAVRQVWADMVDTMEAMPGVGGKFFNWQAARRVIECVRKKLACQ